MHSKAAQGLKISLTKKIPGAEFGAADVEKQRNTAQTLTMNAECEELPGKRCVLHVEFYCTLYQVSEVIVGLFGHTAFQKTQAFSKNILPVVSWKIYTNKAVIFFNITALSRKSSKLEPNPTLETWLPACCWGKRHF